MTCPHWLRVVWPHSAAGPRIAYTAAQVAARRAAQMVLVVGCTAGASAIGYQAARHAPPGWLGLPEPLPAIHAPVPVWRGLPPAPTWRATGEQVHAVPEPASAPLLAISFVVLVAVRNWRRHGRSDLFIHPADPERGYQQAALSLHDAVGREP